MRRRSRRTWSVSNRPHARYIPKEADLVQTPPAFGRQFLFISALRRDPPSKFETILPIKGRHMESAICFGRCAPSAAKAKTGPRTR